MCGECDRDENTEFDDRVDDFDDDQEEDDTTESNSE